MKDYKQDSAGDLDISSGDLVITESTGQHQRDLILADKGQIRNAPQAGVGTNEYLQDNAGNDYLRKVRMEFAADGMNVRKIESGPLGNLLIDAEYENR